MLLCNLSQCFKSIIDCGDVVKTIVLHQQTTVRLFVDHTELKISRTNLQAERVGGELIFTKAPCLYSFDKLIRL